MDNIDKSYFDHLEELRYRIIFCLIFFIIIFVILFYFRDKILLILNFPLNNLNIKLYFMKPHEKFLTFFEMSLFSSLILTMPVIFIQLMIFIYPALINTIEKIIFWIFIFIIPLFFIMSILFSYYILIPFSYQFFIKFSNNNQIIPMISFSSHISYIINIILISLILFQLPIILSVLILLNITKLETIENLRSYIIVFIFIISAILTPPDVISQIILAIPLYLLFEITILITKIIQRIIYKKNKKGGKHG